MLFYFLLFILLLVPILDLFVWTEEKVLSFEGLLIDTQVVVINHLPTYTCTLT